MANPLDESYAFCCRHARKTAKNFYYSFLGLPPRQFRSMCALYSYMRVCDDIGDDESVPVSTRRVNLAKWESVVQKTLTTSLQLSPEGEGTALFEIGHKVLPTLRDLVDRYSIPHRYLVDVIRGVGMDLEGPFIQDGSPAFSGDISQRNQSFDCRYQTFDELRDYCYHVAGVVGLCCIHVWGFSDKSAIERAIECGLAFQLTNILRDLGEDADNGRVYLPAEDLDRFEYSPSDIRLRVNDDRFQALMEFQVARAEECYEKARELFQYLEPSGRTILKAMVRIYGGLLGEIRKRNFDVYSRHISLPIWQKMLIAADAIIRRRFQRQPRKTAPEV